MLKVTTFVFYIFTSVLYNDCSRLGISRCRKHLEWTDVKGKTVKCSASSSAGVDENSNIEQYVDINVKLNNLKPLIRLVNFLILWQS